MSDEETRLRKYATQAANSKDRMRRQLAAGILLVAALKAKHEAAELRRQLEQERAERSMFAGFMEVASESA